MENKDITYIKLLITVGVLLSLFLASVIILFVVYYQRKILQKESRIQLMEKEKQIDLFKATVIAEEGQKEKIARNLHDEINPWLMVLKHNLSLHRIHIKKNIFQPQSLIADEDLIDKIIDGIRVSCHNLIPTFLLSQGLLKALEEYIRNIQQNEAQDVYIKSEVTQEELSRFDKTDQLNIYRVCLELINNLIKHSYFSVLQVHLTSENNSLKITFTHNGEGITNEEINIFTESAKGLGLKSLKARVLLLDATINYIQGVERSVIHFIISHKNARI